MYNNSRDNVIALSTAKSSIVGAYDDPVHDLLHEFDHIALEEPNDTMSCCENYSINFSDMSEDQLLEFIENKIDSIKDLGKRLNFYTSEIELHNDL